MPLFGGFIVFFARELVLEWHYLTITQGITQVKNDLCKFTQVITYSIGTHSNHHQLSLECVPLK